MTATERAKAYLLAIFKADATTSEAESALASEFEVHAKAARNETVTEALDLVRVLRAHAQARHDGARYNDREWSEAEISALDDAAHDIATLKEQG